MQYGDTLLALTYLAALCCCVDCRYTSAWTAADLGGTLCFQDVSACYLPVGPVLTLSG